MKSGNTDKRRRILRKIYGTLSLSTALFVFQACYGPPKDLGEDVSIQGCVMSNKTKLPISGIKVTLENFSNPVFTDSLGQFSFYTKKETTFKLKFEDIDSIQNGFFSSKDTIITVVDETTQLNVFLDAK